jgi:Tfp pilus assembly PilM family ATPase
MTRAVAEEAAVGLDDAEQLKRSIDIAAPSGPSKAAAALQARFDGILLEIRRSVDYYKTTFRERSVAGTVLTGGVALTTGIVEYFSRALEGSVELDDPFAGMAMKKMLLNEYGPQAPRFSAAVGLGLRKA